MCGFQIAVIDSGIESTHDRLRSHKITGVTINQCADGFQTVEGNFDDVSGHGTAIAGIITKMVSEVPIVAVKLTSAAGGINELLLSEGIKYCIDRNDIKIINVSLGVATNSPRNELYEVCKKASDKGIFIVAAIHNSPGYECYPACFPFVFGVAVGNIKDKMSFGYKEGGAATFIAKGTTMRMAWLNNSYRITSGTSFAAAHFTGILTSIMLKRSDYSFRELNDCLRERADKDITELQYIKPSARLSIPTDYEENDDRLGERLFTSRHNLWFASKISLFAVCEKEMKTVLDFRECCKYEIAHCIDYPRSYNFNTQTSHPEIQIFRRQLSPAEFESFDTLVVGYFLDQLFDANILFGQQLIDDALKFNKNIVTWDANVYKYIKERVASNFPAYTGHLYIPSVSNKIFEKVTRFRYLPHSRKPVILVIGTSNKQGKVTTQLRVRQVMESEGYKVSHICTEPQGLLLNASFTFPYGHKSTVTLPEHLWGKFMYAVVKGIERYENPHLIITGVQGGILPRTRTIEELHGEAVFSSLNFVLGIQPDSLICAINPQDSIELISNTITTVQNYCKARVLFFTMTPWLRDFKISKNNTKLAYHRFLNEKEMNDKMEEFRKQLGMPVINIMDPRNNKFITDSIERAFSGKQE